MKPSAYRRATAYVVILALSLASLPVLSADTTPPTVSISSPGSQVMGTVDLSSSVFDAGGVRFGTCEWCVSTSSSTCTSAWTSDNATESAPSSSEDQGQTSSLSTETSLSDIHARLTQGLVPGADQVQSTATTCAQDFDKSLSVAADVKQDTGTSNTWYIHSSNYRGEYLVLPRGDVAVLPVAATTCEELARWLHGRLAARIPTLARVRVWESERSCAVYPAGSTP